ncbi:MAG TPA: hypothetical protein VK509_19335 [Polyangiales bacterium]|nr:hypothetical protein [Polyangiales bacterium]
MSGAQAQAANPEGGDVAPPPGAGASGTASASASWPSPTATATSNVDADGEGDAVDTGVDTDPGESDHSAVVSHLGVGFFGVQTLPLPTNPAELDEGGLSAPTIGVRYWMDDFLGIEAALGLNVTSQDTGPMSEFSAFGFALHGGVPLALAHSGHFVFEIVPLINFGIASGSFETTAGGMTATQDISGLLLEVGARVGAEIHFGFIDLPSLSLQGTVGLSVRHENRSTTPPGGMEASAGSTVLATSVGDEPWDIFTGGITAIYYL